MEVYQTILVFFSLCFKLLKIHESHYSSCFYFLTHPAVKLSISVTGGRKWLRIGLLFGLSPLSKEDSLRDSDHFDELADCSQLSDLRSVPRTS